MRVRMKRGDQIGFHWIVINTINERFKCFQPKSFFSYLNFLKKNEIEHLQLHLLCLGNNQYKNNSKRIFELTKLIEKLGFLYL